MGRRGIASVIIIGAAFGTALATAARAEVDNFWSQFGFGGPAAEWDQPYDRSQARNWELNPPRGYPTLSKANIAPMKAAIKRYARIAAKGGWKPIPKGQTLRTGMSGRAVQLLRRRLELTGDLKPGSGLSNVYDYYVEQAVKRFQKRHGLSPSGIADKTTIMALNVPASARLRQLRTNLGRLVSLSRNPGKKYVLVNIPAAQIEAVENNRVVSRHAAVVGKYERQTPILRSTISQISFNPYWTVPPTVLRKDLIPKARQYARRGKDILAAYRMTAYDSRGRKLDPKKINWFSDAVYNYTYRQEPWEENSMGFVKIHFPNKYAVFLHDTPLKSLFGRNFRAASSGCVRVQNVKQFVAWLLKDNKGWSRRRIDQIKASGERIKVKPARRIPVYLAYITAWATPDGTVNFRRDIYKRDRVGLLAAAY